jgi:peptide/nickel transport system substrate-binding protein
MKKLASLIVALAMLVSLGAAAGAEGYSQAPMLDELVESGALPPLEERLPDNPKVADDRSAEYLEDGEFEIGNYGGTIRSGSMTPNYNGDVFIMLTENLLTMVDTYSGEVTPNLVEAYEVNDDYTEFTFTLRKGLKWSDGAEVTMEDFRFAFEDYIFNTELTPVVDAYLRAGGKSTGAPLVFEVIDDDTFKITFEESYGGFLVHLSVAGWKGYGSYLKPSHFMKQFHKDYAEQCHGSMDAYYEFLAPYGECLGYYDVTEDGVWAQILNQIDALNSAELTDSSVMLTSRTFAGAGLTENLPVLHPWMMVDDSNNIITWERNPYYFKVDAEGQQLPYCDYVTSTLVEDQEMLQMKIITGEIDYLRESATINNVTMYLENEEAAGIKVHFYSLNNTPTDVAVNVNYGLNVDGTVKDDEICQAWQEVINDHRFMEALACAIDVDEIIETVYTGFAEPDSFFTDRYSYDPEYANQILDDMGMNDVDGDGYRETPSGKKLQWMIFNADDASDIIPVCELLVEYWNVELGLNVTATTIENSLLATSVAANEIPMRVAWYPIDITWFNLNWGQATFAPLWDTWYINGGMNAADGENVGGLRPTEEMIEFYTLLEAVMTGSPDEAVNEVLPAMHNLMADNLWLIVPLQNVQQSVIANADLHNIPVGGVGIAGNFVAELFFYED